MTDKTTATEQVAAEPVFEIAEYVAPAKPRKANPYDGHVAKLIEAGDGKVGKITVLTAHIGSTKRLFSEAARHADRSARFVSEQPAAVDGSTVLTFKLGAKRAEKGSATAPESANVEV